MEYIVGGGLALALGAALSVANYLIARKLLEKNGNRLAIISILRQMLNIAYLVAIYFLAEVLPWPVEAMLIGGAAGITVPSFPLAARLARRAGAGADENQKTQTERKDG